MYSKLSMRTQNQYTECAQSYQCKPKFNELNVLKVINTNPKSIYWMCSKLSIKTWEYEYDFAYLVYALYHIKFLHLAATLIYFSKPISELLPSRNK